MGKVRCWKEFVLIDGCKMLEGVRDPFFDGGVGTNFTLRESIPRPIDGKDLYQALEDEKLLLVECPNIYDCMVTKMPCPHERRSTME